MGGQTKRKEGNPATNAANRPGEGWSKKREEKES